EWPLSETPSKDDPLPYDLFLSLPDRLCAVADMALESAPARGADQDRAQLCTPIRARCGPSQCSARVRSCLARGCRQSSALDAGLRPGDLCRARTIDGEARSCSQRGSCGWSETRRAPAV